MTQTRRHKYNAIPTTVDGIRFDSKREAKRYGELRLLVQAGEIRDLQLQPEFEIEVTNPQGEKVPCGKYIADFWYLEDGRAVVEDAKGHPTPLYKFKRKLVEALYGLEIHEV